LSKASRPTKRSIGHISDKLRVVYCSNGTLFSENLVQ